MNKKLIFLILSFTTIVVVSNYVTYIITGESYAPGLISIERIDFNGDVEYISLYQQTLEDFSQIKNGLDEADHYVKIDSNSNSITRQKSHTTVVELDNKMTKKFDSLLEGLSTPDSRRDNFYYLESDEKYYFVGIHICFPNFPAFAD